MLAQKVSHASRVHLDIETDDIEAEVKRLEALGAKRIEKIETWWVVRTPLDTAFASSVRSVTETCPTIRLAGISAPRAEIRRFPTGRSEPGPGYQSHQEVPTRPL